MAQDEIVRLLRAIKDDMEVIRRYISFVARGAMSEVLNKIATTTERQQMWRLCDGNRSTEQIAQEIGVTVRTVQYFIQEAEEANLMLMEKRGYPKRVEDVYPSDWKPWKAKGSQSEIRACARDET